MRTGPSARDEVQSTLELGEVVQGEHATVISSFTAVFPFIYTLTRGGPGYSTYTLDYYVYDKAFFGGAMGYASAVGVVLLVIVGGLAVAQIVLLRRGSGAAAR